jgi:hypothetical protein
MSCTCSTTNSYWQGPAGPLSLDCNSDTIKALFTVGFTAQCSPIPDGQPNNACWWDTTIIIYDSNGNTLQRATLDAAASTPGLTISPGKVTYIQDCGSDPVTIFESFSTLPLAPGDYSARILLQDCSGADVIDTTTPFSVVKCPPSASISGVTLPATIAAGSAWPVFSGQITYTCGGEGGGGGGCCFCVRIFLEQKDRNGTWGSVRDQRSQPLISQTEGESIPCAGTTTVNFSWNPSGFSTDPGKVSAGTDYRFHIQIGDRDCDHMDSSPVYWGADHRVLDDSTSYLFSGV